MGLLIQLTRVGLPDLFLHQNYNIFVEHRSKWRRYPHLHPRAGRVAYNTLSSFGGKAVEKL
jgi:hypothetical protein